MANNIYFEKICAPPKDQSRRRRAEGHNTTGTVDATHIGLNKVNTIDTKYEI